MVRWSLMAALLLSVTLRPYSAVALSSSSLLAFSRSRLCCWVTPFPSSPPSPSGAGRHRHLLSGKATSSLWAMATGSEAAAAGVGGAVEEMPREAGGGDSVTLLLATSEDPASTNLWQALIDKGGWVGGGEVEGWPCWTHEARSDVCMWKIAKGFLREDHLDDRWTAAMGQPVRDVVFLSRHAARSGKPSLTLHPIGNPGTAGPPTTAGGADAWQGGGGGGDGGDDGATSSSSSEVLLPEFGGRWGRCVPPSPRLAPWFRRLHRHVMTNQQATTTPALQDYEVTLEATHHGPWLRSPSMFVEIGSQEEHWGRRDAAQAWAQVIYEALGLEQRHTPPPPPRQQEEAASVVVVGLGGGHYAPRFNDLLLKRSDVHLGHVVASYGLDMQGLQGGRWREAVREAIQATAQAYNNKEGGVRVVAYVDKKAFKGGDRDRLVAFLEGEDMGVQVAMKATDIIITTATTTGTATGAALQQGGGKKNSQTKGT